MPVKQYHRFTPFTEDGMEFIKMWNSADRDGAQKKIADRFGISITLVYRIRIKLGLPDLHDAKKHPGKMALYKRIKKLYLHDERSTSAIGEIVRMCDERINQILKEQNIPLRPQHCTNPKYFKTRSGITPYQLLKKIKHLYCDGNMSAKRIARQLGIDQGTVCKKLKAMRVELRQNKRDSRMKEGGYRCQWCRVIMPTVYINTGPRKQLYCCSGHKNKAKDLRRMLRGNKVSQTRLTAMETELKIAWGDEYDEVRSRILSAEPAVNKLKERIRKNKIMEID